MYTHTHKGAEGKKCGYSSAEDEEQEQCIMCLTDKSTKASLFCLHQVKLKEVYRDLDLQAAVECN